MSSVDTQQPENTNRKNLVENFNFTAATGVAILLFGWWASGEFNQMSNDVRALTSKLEAIQISIEKTRENSIDQRDLNNFCLMLESVNDGFKCPLYNTRDQKIRYFFPRKK